MCQTLQHNRSDQRGRVTHMRVSRTYHCLTRQSSGPLCATTQLRCIDHPALLQGEDTPFPTDQVCTPLYLTHITVCMHTGMHSHWLTHTDIHIRTHPHIPHMHENTHNTHIYTQCKIYIYTPLRMVQLFQSMALQLHVQMSQSFASTWQPGSAWTGARSAPTSDCSTTSCNRRTRHILTCWRKRQWRLL